MGGARVFQRADCVPPPEDFVPHLVHCDFVFLGNNLRDQGVRSFGSDATYYLAPWAVGRDV